MTSTETLAPSPATPSPATPARSNQAQDSPTLHPGLKDIVLASTCLSRVDGERGELVLAGYPVEELAPRVGFESAAWLLVEDRLPSGEELGVLRRHLASRRALPPATLELLRQAAARALAPMTALRLATPTLALDAQAEAPADLPWDSEELGLLARLPRIVAAYHRLRRGLEPLNAPADDTGENGTAADFLAALAGSPPAASAARALDTYLVTVCDHGANASTFTARVIVSTGADVTSAVLGALGALSGPLHGGAPGPALDMIKAIGEPSRAEEVLRSALARGERLMGFGHRIYRVRDPRAAVLSAAAERLYADPESGADPRLFALTRHVEEVAVRLLDEHKPGRRLRANVELYTALLLDGLGFPSDLFTPVFALGRTAGWLAHCREQRSEGNLIRPRLHYAGAEGRQVES